MARKLKSNKKEENYEKATYKDIIGNSLNIIILMLLNKRSLSGFELIEQIKEKFGVLFNSSTVYPFLYSFKNRGLLTSYKEGKSIKYKIKNGQKVHKILYHYFWLRRTLEKMMKKK